MAVHGCFLHKTVQLSENPCYTLDRSGLIESPYIPATRTRFVQPGKIEIDANERAVIGKRNAAFSFAPSSHISNKNFPHRKGVLNLVSRYAPYGTYPCIDPDVRLSRIRLPTKLIMHFIPRRYWHRCVVSLMDTPLAYLGMFSTCNSSSGFCDSANRTDFYRLDTWKLELL